MCNLSYVTMGFSNCMGHMKLKINCIWQLQMVGFLLMFLKMELGWLKILPIVYLNWQMIHCNNFKFSKSICMLSLITKKSQQIDILLCGFHCWTWTSIVTNWTSFYDERLCQTQVVHFQHRTHYMLCSYAPH
jgi:hypothetical protein